MFNRVLVKHSDGLDPIICDVGELEDVILSEVSQAQNDQQSMISRIYEI